MKRLERPRIMKLDLQRDPLYSLIVSKCDAENNAMII